MNKKQKLVPEIRFKGYTDAWEQRKLNDMADFSKGSGYSKADLVEKGHPVILYGRLYTKYETVIEIVDSYTELKEKSIISKGGEVIVPASGESTEDISRASVVDIAGVALGGDLNIIKTNDELDPTFLALTISNGSQQKEISKRAQGKSVVHLHNSDLKEINLRFPNVEEQKKIGTFFRKIDNLITLHQRKLRLLKQLKQAYLQQMFPQNDEKNPLLRFANFSKEWEQHKLGEVCSEFKSGGFIKAEDISNTGVYPVFGGNGLRGYTDRYNHDGDYALIGRQGALCGNMNYSTGKAYFTEHAVVVTGNSTNDTLFLFYRMNTMNLGQYSGQSAQPGLAVTNLIKLKILLPQKSEQEQIGNLFRTLDDAITLHHKKLDNLKQIKTAYLKSMFI